MVDQVDEQKKEAGLKVKPKTEEYKTYAIIGLALLAGYLLYFNYKKGNLVLQITGQQVLLAILFIGVILFWYFRMQGVQELPEKDEIAFYCADWHYRAGYGLADFTQTEVTRLSDQRAAVHFPNSAKTLIYQAGKGVIEERWRDIEREIKSREEGDLVRAMNAQKNKDENLRDLLRQRGFIAVDE